MKFQAVNKNHCSLSFKLIVSLALYFPLEDFLLKWLPVSETVFVGLRELPDVIAAGLLLLVILRKILSGRLPSGLGGKIDLFVALFFLCTLISALVNEADPLVYVIQIKGLFRYLVLAYVIVALNPTRHEIGVFMKAVSVSAALQIGVGALQLVGGIPARDFLVGRQTTDQLAGFQIAFTGTRFEGVNNLMGTMGNTINYGLFLVVGLCVWISGKTCSSMRYWLTCLVFLTSIYLTGARSPVIAAIIVVLCHQGMLHGRRRVLSLTSGLVVLLTLFVLCGVQASEVSGGSAEYGSRTRFFSMFSSGYLEEAMNQRLGMAVYVVPKVFSSEKVLFGYSSDKAVFVDYVRGQSGIPDVIAAVLPGIIEDVYWFAMLFYYGAIGLGIFLMLVIILYSRQRKLWRLRRDWTQGRVAIVATFLLLTSVPVNLFNQAFTIRQFSFYLWTFVALSIAYSRRCSRVGVGPQATKAWLVSHNR